MTTPTNLWRHLLESFPDLIAMDGGVSCDILISRSLVAEEGRMVFNKTPSLSQEMIMDAIIKFYRDKGYRVVPGVIGGGHIERGKDEPWLGWVTTVSDYHLLVSIYVI